MKDLISTHSAVYKRRLVRLLNQAGIVNGFMWNSLRCNRARYVDNGYFQVRSLVQGWLDVDLADEYFEDVHGEEIVASRKAK